MYSMTIVSGICNPNLLDVCFRIEEQQIVKLRYSATRTAAQWRIYIMVNTWVQIQEVLVLVSLGSLQVRPHAWR